LRVSNQSFESSSDTFTSAIGQVNFLRVSGDAITLFDKFGDGVAHVVPSHRVRSVSTDGGVALILEFFHAALGVLTNRVCLEQRLVYEASNHLTVESDGSLAYLLRVPNVKGDCFCESIVVDSIH
jgi:hypothetical protein